MATHVSGPLTRFCLKSIRIYQRTLSPDTGLFAYRHPYGFCRFSPTCSEFAHESIRRRGVARGITLAIFRLFRCHPWNAGGYDPVP